MMLTVVVFQLTYAQPVQVKRIPDGSYGFFSAINNLYFFHNDSLWKSDGTAAGTTPLKYVAGQGITPLEEVAFQITNAFFFEVRNGTQYTLWRSNGTAGGTTSIGSYSAINLLDVLNDHLIFSAASGGVINLYKVGLGMPQLITTVAPAEGETTGGLLLFSVFKPSGGSELWRTDGTTAGTLKIKEFPDAIIEELENVDGTLFFVYKVFQDELWKSNGILAGTVMIESHELTEFYRLTAHEGSLYFAGYIDNDESDLFVTNGTPGAAEKLFENIGHASIDRMKDVKDVLALEITLDGADEVIWRTNGVTEQIYHTIQSIQDFTPVNQHLFFKDDGLWQSDMTEVNTKKITDIFPGLVINDPADLVAVNDELFFTTPDGAGYIILWQYNPLVPSLSQPYFTVVNAKTGQDKAWLMEGDTIYLYPDETINIRFNPLTNPESVRFVLNGSTLLTENTAPFALAGDNNGNYNVWKAQEGTYTLVARQYSGNNASGALLATHTIHFYVGKEPVPPIVNAGADKALNSVSSTTLSGTVSVPEGKIISVNWSALSGPAVNAIPVFSDPGSLSTGVSGLSYPGVYRFRLTVTLSNGTSGHDDVQVTVTGQAIESFNLINADTDEIVYGNFGNGHIFYLSHYPTSNFNIMTVPATPAAGSIRFVYDGKVTIENVAPYAVYGDNNGNYNPGPLTLGTHSLSATPYSGPNATGIRGLTTTITFTAVLASPPFVDPGQDEQLFLSVSSTVLSGIASGNARIFATREASAISSTCFPNPSRENFMISFLCPGTASGCVEIYHGTGKLMLTLFEGNVIEGEEMNLMWNTAGIMRGVYILKISTGARTGTQKLVLD